MGVLAIWRYPVKAMLGELLEAVDVTRGGLDGDRRWVVEDDGTRERIANKRGPTDARLRACRARLAPDGRLIVELPDGKEAVGADEVAEALSELLGRHLRLDEHPGGGDRYLRTDGHHDFAPLHLLTTRTLACMEKIAPNTDWDVRRFRPNVVLEGGDDAELLGGGLRSASGLRIDIGLPTPRCVVPTRSRQELPADPGLLKSVAREHRWALGPFGRPACLGVYAEVMAAGRLGTGERLTFTPRTEASAQAAVDACVSRVVATLG